MIDANALIKETIEEKRFVFQCDEILEGIAVKTVYKDFIDVVNKQPEITLDDIRPKGEWIECDYVEYDGHGECIHYPKEGLKCSNCCNAFKKDLLWKDNFCPNCGADMGSERGK